MTTSLRHSGAITHLWQTLVSLEAMEALRSLINDISQARTVSARVRWKPNYKIWNSTAEMGVVLGQSAGTQDIILGRWLQTSQNGPGGGSWRNLFSHVRHIGNGKNQNSILRVVGKDTPIPI
ncbi:hypothetical protein GX51_02240 [Blastomyces parvus]|uniref:Uncharacterized protein n=1 Tax=Blastomyces parvus TaxID=2060905 RepID=A0A2B7XCZ3_9EURO|nr:hypothetical protein GX51_02240 [Blastomyces parvus]